jgi:hypothetical protein
VQKKLGEEKLPIDSKLQEQVCRGKFRNSSGQGFFDVRE